MKHTVEIIRSKRKTISIEVREDGSVVARCPYGVSREKIKGFLEEKADWIDMHVKKKQSQQATVRAQGKFTPEELQLLKKKAAPIFAARVAYYAGKMGVTYGRITIRSQKSRWGSCSAQGNLNFNCLLLLTSQEVLDYVVVHELCHRKEMNHSARFWQEVERIMPNYRVHRKWLKENGGKLIARL